MPKMFVIRGIPGMGKTVASDFLALWLRAVKNEACVVLSKDYFWFPEIMMSADNTPPSEEMLQDWLNNRTSKERMGIWVWQEMGVDGRLTYHAYAPDFLGQLQLINLSVTYPLSETQFGHAFDSRDPNYTVILTNIATIMGYVLESDSQRKKLSGMLNPTACYHEAIHRALCHHVTPICSVGYPNVPQMFRELKQFQEHTQIIYIDPAELAAPQNLNALLFLIFSIMARTGHASFDGYSASKRIDILIGFFQNWQPLNKKPIQLHYTQELPNASEPLKRELHSLLFSLRNKATKDATLTQITSLASRYMEEHSLNSDSHHLYRMNKELFFAQFSKLFAPPKPQKGITEDRSESTDVNTIKG